MDRSVYVRLLLSTRNMPGTSSSKNVVLARFCCCMLLQLVYIKQQDRSTSTTLAHQLCSLDYNEILYVLCTYCPVETEAVVSQV